MDVHIISEFRSHYHSANVTDFELFFLLLKKKVSMCILAGSVEVMNFLNHNHFKIKLFKVLYIHDV